MRSFAVVQMGYFALLSLPLAPDRTALFSTAGLHRISFLQQQMPLPIEERARCDVKLTVLHRLSFDVSPIGESMLFD
jgi:hypothetical protein